jgi:hypothetical protein
MDFCDAMDLLKYWRECPPVHLLIRAYVRYETPTEEDERREAAQAVMVLTSGRKGSAKKLDRAPKHLQEAAARMKEEMKNRKKSA